MFASFRPRWPIALVTASMVLGLTLPSAAAPLPAAVVESVDFVTPSVGYAVVARGAGAVPRLYRTLDAGGHWVAAGTLPSGKYPYLSADIGFSTSESGIALMSLGVGACQAGWGVYRSSSGGRAWQAAGRIIGSDGPVAVAAVPGGDPWMLNGSCAGAYAILYRGSGKAWRELREFALPATETKAFISPSAASLQRMGTARALAVLAYYPGQPKGYPPLIVGYSTRDVGSSWQPVTIENHGLGGTVSAIAFYSASEGLAVVRSSSGRSTLYVTRDRGGRWLPVQAVPIPESVYQTSIEWLSAKVADILVGRQIWRSVDGGSTWRVITSRWPS